MKRIIKILILTFFFLLPFNVFGLDNEKVKLYLFYGDGCPHCAEEKKFLSSIENKYSNLEIVKYEVWHNDSNASLLNEVSDKLKIKRTGVPTTIIGESVFTGYSEALNPKLERAITYYSENEYIDVVEQIKNGTFVENKDKLNGEFDKLEEKSDETSTIDVPIIGKLNLKKISLMSASVIIGLIDGFNPCAMWVLLFLISVLIGMKNKKRMWTLGLTFLVVSALVYMFIMLSWLNIAVKITTVIWIRNLIAIVALIGAFINIKSYFKSHDGCSVVDDKKRKNIFKKIRKFTSEKSLILAIVGIIGLAVSVNLVELACSAGLPLVFTELLALNNVSSFMRFMYTLLYILFFLVDDLIVFFIAMFTMEVSGISTKYNKYSHLLGGLIMLAIGLLLIFKPEWLMFQFK